MANNQAAYLQSLTAAVHFSTLESCLSGKILWAIQEGGGKLQSSDQHIVEADSIASNWYGLALNV